MIRRGRKLWLVPAVGAFLVAVAGTFGQAQQPNGQPDIERKLIGRWSGWCQAPGLGNAQMTWTFGPGRTFAMVSRVPNVPDLYFDGTFRYDPSSRNLILRGRLKGFAQGGSIWTPRLRLRGNQLTLGACELERE